jgi:acetyl esterase/lipase
MPPSERHEITRKKVVYELPGTEHVVVHRALEYGSSDAGSLTLDIYIPPPHLHLKPVPVVFFILGYADVGVPSMLGCKLREMEIYISWARLIAASGMAAVTYSSRNPETNVDRVLEYVSRSSAELNIDFSQIGLWSCSGNVPNALSVLMKYSMAVKCAVLSYGYVLDLDGSRGTADAAKRWGFVNPCEGKSVDDLPRSVPLFVVRAGKDEMPQLNETLDRFVGAALSQNLPITLVNHAQAPHAFDMMDDSETSREVIRQMLAFLRFHLFGALHADPPRSGL